jgi:hypothetical protein
MGIGYGCSLGLIKSASSSEVLAFILHISAIFCFRKQFHTSDPPKNGKNKRGTVFPETCNFAITI